MRIDYLDDDSEFGGPSYVDITLSFYQSLEDLLSWPGVCAWDLGLGGPKPVLYLPSPMPYVFYEAAAHPEGWWFVQTSPVPLQQWQEAEPVKATGLIPGTYLYRPKSHLWWVPAGDIEPYLGLRRVLGSVIVPAPDGPPPPFFGGGPGDDGERPAKRRKLQFASE